MTFAPLSNLAVKLELVRMHIRDLEELYPTMEDGADRLHSVLKVYEQLLMREQAKSETDLRDLFGMKEAVRECGGLLYDLGAERTEEMDGWFHGIPPRNRAMALANLLSRLILDFTRVVMAFESKYPKLKVLFRREYEQRSAHVY